MNFWTAKLAGQSPPPRPTTDIDAWWATTAAPAQQQSDAPGPTAEESPRTTARMTPSGQCPNCQSGNFSLPEGLTAGRCFDCGYPKLQSTSGMVIARGTPQGRPVRQAETSGYQPLKIVGRGL